MPPRPLRPKDGVSNADGGEAINDVKPGKRRAVSSACIPCRKRKSKCDGNLPSCSTCVAVYRTECSYDADSDHRRKGALKRDLQSLQQRNDALDVIVASLRALPEADAIALLQSLRSDTNPDVIAASLRSNTTPSSSFSQTPQTDSSQPGDSNRSGTSSAASGSTTADSATFPPPRLGRNSISATKVTPNRSTWFRTNLDNDYVDSLLDLYFCWVHPFYHFFSKEHFLFDFRNGRTENCSPALVNAILSIACNYADQPQVQGKPYGPQAVSDFFFNEAKFMLDRDDGPTLTMVQAFAVMSIREMSAGRDSSAYQYAGRCVRLSSEMNLNLGIANKSPQFIDAEARKITFWGVFNLETLTSVSLGRSAQLPRSLVDIAKPTLNDRIESQIWRPYIYGSNDGVAAEHRMHCMLFSNCFSQLCELANDMISTFYAPKESFTSRKLAIAFASYQEWYGNLPEPFWLENTSLPHVVVLHMCYHAYVLHLFRPYLKLDLHAAKLFPRETCISSANEISTLMGALRSLYGLQRVCPAVVGILYSASTIHLLNLNTDTSAANLEQAVHDLSAIAACHPYAQRCVDNIKSLAAKWNINLRAGIAPTMNGVCNDLLSPSTAQMPPTSHPRQAGFSQEAPIKQEPYPYGNTFGQAQQLSDGCEDPVAMTDILHTQVPVWTPMSMPSLPFRQTDMSGMSFQPSNTNDWTGFGMPVNQQLQQGDVRRSSAPEHVDETSPVTPGNWQWDR